MKRSSPIVANLAAVVTVLLWASAFVAIRSALRTTNAAALSIGRLSVASVAFIVLAIVRRRPLAIPRTEWKWIAASGFLGMSAYQLLLNAGEVHVPAATAAILVNVGPIFTVLGARMFFRETLTQWTVRGGAIALAGAVIVAISAEGGLQLSGSAVLVLLAAASQAGYFLIIKRLLRTISPFDATIASMWAGTLFLLPGLALQPLPSTSNRAWIAILYLGIGPSAIGFLAWSYALAHLPVGRTSLSLYAVPLVALGLGIPALHEHPTIAALTGGIIAIIGVGLSRRTKPPTPRNPLDNHAPGSRPRKEPSPT